jgi:transcriptional regulator with XRE-family HTH domain
MNFAKVIREAREKLNLNQSQLADLVGVSPQAVQQWESGATQPRGKRLSKIAEVLKLSPTLMHFGIFTEVRESATVKAAQELNATEYKRERRGGQSSVPEKPPPTSDPLIDQVVEAMRRMSAEDAARLVTISKALAGGARIEEAEIDLKPLPTPDLAPHPPPAFPPRRLPGGSRTKARGKTAIGR